MDTGTASPLNEQEKREFFNLEKKWQPKMDAHYKLRGHTIKSREGDRQRDLTLELKTGETDQIEEKYRDFGKGQQYNDVLIEMVQDAVSGDLGWFYHTGCDHLHYIICDTAGPLYYYRIWWGEFKPWYLNSYLRDKKAHQTIVSDRGWGLTFNLSVPVSAIPARMIKRIVVRAETPTPISVENKDKAA